MKNSEKVFVRRLTNGEFKTASDPIGKRYVRIRKIITKPSGNIEVVASRVCDGQIIRYNQFQLINFCEF